VQGADRFEIPAPSDLGQVPKPQGACDCLEHTDLSSDAALAEFSDTMPLNARGGVDSY
jgi:hypothetical protein